MHLSEITENSESSSYFYFFYFFLTRATCQLKSSPPDCLSGNQNSTTNSGSICTRSHLLSLMYHFPHLRSLCLHSEGSTNQDGLFLERNKPSKKYELLVEAAQHSRSSGGGAAEILGDLCKPNKLDLRIKKNWIFNICSVNIRLS